MDALGADHLAPLVIDVLLDPLDRAFEGDVLEAAAGMEAGGVSWGGS
jgi:hypothetical protein